MANHARLAPSASHRWLACAASVPLSDGLPRTSSEYADEGTAAHTVASHVLEKNIPASTWLGRGVAAGERMFKVEQEMVDAVQAYVDHVREAAGDGVIMVEQSLPIGRWTNEEGAHGTSDAVVIRGNELQVHDLKYGRGVQVDAEENEQLMIYALGALDAYEDLVGGIETVRLFIHQPRLNHHSEWSCSIEHLKKFGLRVTTAALTVENATNTLAEWRDDATSPFYAPSESVCTFCPVKAKCVALTAYVQLTVGASFEMITESDVAAAELAPAADNDELARKMRAVEVVEDWCRAVRAEVEGKLLAGEDVPGFKLVAGKRGNRKWIDEDNVLALLKSMRLTRDEIYDISLASPAVLEKRMKESPIKWKKIAEHVTQTDGKPSVAPITDKRPAIQVASTADTFTDLTVAD